MKNDTIKLWAFYYNHMIYESSAEIISYHRTKKGAEAAMRKHKEEEKKEFDRMYSKDPKGWKPKFGSFESWFVHKLDLVIED